jgi:hypothetical protein
MFEMKRCGEIDPSQTPNAYFTIAAGLVGNGMSHVFRITRKVKTVKSRSGKELATISWHRCVIVLLTVCAAKPDTHSRFRLTDSRSVSENFLADEVSFSLLV